MNNFIKELKQYRHLLSKQTISTLKGQAISGDLIGAKKGLDKALNIKLSKSDKFTNAHRNTRYMVHSYGVDYNSQLGISLEKR